MAETRRKFDQDFREGAVRLVRETGKPVAQVARDLGINEGTLGNWVNADKRRRGDGTGVLDEDERAARLRKENAELAMVTCSNAAWPPGSRTRWGGSGGRADCRPGGSAPYPAHGGLPGAGGVRSWFYKWIAGTPGPRALRRDRLKSEVARLFRRHAGKYGSPRITADLREDGWQVSKNTVAAVRSPRGGSGMTPRPPPCGSPTTAGSWRSW